MKINIDVPVKRDQIKQVLEESTDVKYTYLGQGATMTQLQFEVDETTVPGGNPVAFTKAKIKGAMGSMVVFRVLEDGKNW